MGGTRAPALKVARPMLEVAELRKSYGRRLVLDHVSLSASQGEMIAITGDSGAGKTTLLRLFHGQLRPDRGRLWVDGHPLHRRWLRGAERLRRDTGYVFQEHRLLPRLTAFENVVMAVQLARPEIPYGIAKRAAAEALEAVGLADARRQFPVELSEGEQQRVAVARVLALQPRMILADEPTASLDERSASLVMEQLNAAAKAGSLVVVATHFLDFRASQVVHLPRLLPPLKRKAKRSP